MNFQRYCAEEEQISLSEVRFSEPNLTVYSSENQNKNKNKPFTYIVELQNVFFDNGKAKIIKTDKNKVFRRQRKCSF